MSKQFLYNNTSTFQYFKNIEDNGLSVFSKIEALVKQAIADTPADYGKLFQNSEYLIDLYIQTYKPNTPSHLDKNTVFSNDVGYSISQLDALITDFNTINNKLSQYKLKVVKNGYKSTLKKSDFDKHLKEDLRKKYEALSNFIESSNNLKEFYNINPYQVIKCCDDLLVENLEVKVQYSRFCD